MIYTRTPLRIPFAGGLSDLKPYCARFGGATVSATINQYVHVHAQRSYGSTSVLRYQNKEEHVSSIDEIQNDLIRESMRLLGYSGQSILLETHTDVPSESGLGMSGSITVGILHALHRIKGEEVSVDQLIEEAAHIEVNVLGGASGFHDPAICALGGIQYLKYDGERVFHEQLDPSGAFMKKLQEHLLFFYTNWHHRSTPSLRTLTDDMDIALPNLHKIHDLGHKAKDCIVQDDVFALGKVIAEQQRYKQSLPGLFCDDKVQSLLRTIESCDGLAQLPGGKIGAYVVIFAHPRHHQKIRQVLSPMREMFFSCVQHGTKSQHMAQQLAI